MPRKRYQKRDRQRSQSWRESELEKVLADREILTLHRLAIGLVGLVGLRLHEVEALRWSAFALNESSDEGGGPAASVRVEGPTGRFREVPLHPAVQTLLRLWEESSGQRLRPGARLFPTCPAGRSALLRRWVQHAFLKHGLIVLTVALRNGFLPLCREAGIPDSNVELWEYGMAGGLKGRALQSMADQCVQIGRIQVNPFRAA